MKTTFILHGGFHPGQEIEDNTDFYKEILKHAPENAKVLIVPFAKDSDRIPASTQKVTAELCLAKWQNTISIEVALPELFVNQAKNADVICFQGGASLKLLEALKSYENLAELLDGKIVSGESAGVNVLAKYFYSPRADKVSEGFGILPIKTIPHYKPEYEGKLDHVGTDLELVTLPEYAFKVIYK
jgi:peptidase E